MIQRKNGKHKITYFKKKASTLFTKGCLCALDSDGYLIPCANTTLNAIGVTLLPVATTDSNYTSTERVPVDIGNPTDLWVAEVSAGTIAQTAIGAYYDLNSTGDKVDLSATSYKQAFVVDINSANSTVVVQFNGLASVDETGA